MVTVMVFSFSKFRFVDFDSLPGAAKQAAAAECKVSCYLLTEIVPVDNRPVAKASLMAHRVIRSSHAQRGMLRAESPLGLVRSLKPTSFLYGQAPVMFGHSSHCLTTTPQQHV